jgi:lysophospholipase L1-like esterase
VSSALFRRLLIAGLMILWVPALGRADDSTNNTAVKPAPRKYDWWVKRHDRFVKEAKQGHVDVLFLGDSITQGWEGRGARGGWDAWQKYMAPLHSANFGIGGDRTEHVLWRITQGHELRGIHPKVCVLMIGTNNLGSNTDAQIAEGVEKIVTTLHHERPHMQILLLGIFPRSPKPTDKYRERIKDINRTISRMNGKDNVHYLDIGKDFLEEDGTLSKNIMPDSLHPNARGYEIESKAILPEIKQLLKE